MAATRSLYVSTRPDGTLFHASRRFEAGAWVEFRPPAAPFELPTRILAADQASAVVSGDGWPWRLWRVQAAPSRGDRLSAGLYALRDLTVEQEAPAWLGFGPNGMAVWEMAEALVGLCVSQTDVPAALTHDTDDGEDAYRKRRRVVQQAARDGGMDRSETGPLMVANATFRRVVGRATDGVFSAECLAGGNAESAYQALERAWANAVFWAGQALVVRDHLPAGDYRELTGPFRRFFPGLAHLVD